MAMLSWTKLNPTVKIHSTKKKFFNIYLYKAVVYAPACRVILDKKDKDANSLIQKRIEFLLASKSYNYGGSWFRTHSLDRIRNDANAEQLQFFIDNFDVLKENCKLRFEEPYISIYCNDEKTLYDVCNNKIANRVKEVYTPASDHAQEILNRGEMIVNKNLNYQYKVILRECMIKDQNVKIALSNYLYNLGEAVKPTKSLYQNLQSPSVYFNGGYFYAASDDVITFVNLISPELIGKIYKLAVLE